MKYLLRVTITLLLAITFSLPSYAEDLNYNLYNLSAEVEKEIDNDIMIVTLQASHQALKSSEANQVVNKHMASALKTVKATKGIHYETGNYQTHPTYQNQKITGWKASQQIELKSTDINQLSSLVGDLQEELQISSMRFDVSKQIRQKTENGLSVNALNQFKKRAAVIQKTMGADSYQVVAIDINTGMQRPPVRRAMMRAEMATVSDSPAPSVESGNSTVNVIASGQIQLIFH